MKDILLTGASGFIGKNLLEQLGTQHHILAPTSEELDLLDQQAVAAYFKMHSISDVIHCAVYNRKRRKADSNLDLGANLKMFYNLVEHAPDLDKLIYFGSGAEYDKRYPICMAKEENFGQTIPMLNDYSLSKYLMNIEAQRSTNIYNLRLFGVFGKYEDWENCFISNLCAKAIYGLPLTVRQECVFDFIYVDDLMPVIKWVVENKPLYHDYNVCSGMPVKLTTIARLVSEISQTPLNVKVIAQGNGEEYTGCRQRLDSEFVIPKSDVKKGIEQLFDYYKRIKAEIDKTLLLNS